MFNSPPDIADGQVFDVDENSDNGTVVGTLVASDPDGDTLTYTITNITSNGTAPGGDLDNDTNAPFNVNSC